MSRDRFARIPALFSLLTATVAATVGLTAQTPARPAADVTFTRDIAPILQRSCQECHHPDGVAPMPLVTYEDVRPWAKAIKTRTALRSQRGAMPPFFVEKNIGIQKFKHDPSLSDEEVARVAMWVDNGAPRGNPADMPKALRLRRLRQVDDRRARSDPEVQGRPGAGDGPGLVGRCRPDSDRTHPGSLRLGGRSARGQRYPARRLHEHGRWTLCVSSHDVHEREDGRERAPATSWRAAGRFTRSDATPTSSRRKPAGCCRRTRRCRSTPATFTRTAARRRLISSSPSSSSPSVTSRSTTDRTSVSATASTST